MDQVNTQPVPASQIPPPARSGLLKWILIAGIAVVSISGISAYTILRRSSSNTSTVVSNYSVSPSVVPVISTDAEGFDTVKTYVSDKFGISFKYKNFSGHQKVKVLEKDNRIYVYLQGLSGNSAIDDDYTRGQYIELQTISRNPNIPLSKEPKALFEETILGFDQVGGTNRNDCEVTETDLGIGKKYIARCKPNTSGLQCGQDANCVEYYLYNQQQPSSFIYIFSKDNSIPSGVANSTWQDTIEFLPKTKTYTSQRWGIQFQYSESGHGPYNIYEDENLISIGGNKDKKFDSIERFRIDSSRPEAELNRIIKLNSGFSEDKCLIDLSSVGEAKNGYIKATVVPKNGPHTDSCGKYMSFNSQPFFYHILGTEYLFFITKSGGSLAASETDTGIKAKSAYTIDGWPGTIEFLQLKKQSRVSIKKTDNKSYVVVDGFDDLHIPILENWQYSIESEKDNIKTLNDPLQKLASYYLILKLTKQGSTVPLTIHVNSRAYFGGAEPTICQKYNDSDFKIINDDYLRVLSGSNWSFTHVFWTPKIRGDQFGSVAKASGASEGDDICFNQNLIFMSTNLYRDSDRVPFHANIDFSLPSSVSTDELVQADTIVVNSLTNIKNPW